MLKIKDAVEMMDHIKLITLSEKTNFHFVSFQPNDPKEKENDIKFMFTKSYLAGFIIDNVLYVKAECFKGGKFYNITFETEFAISREFFKLKDIRPIPLNTEEMDKYHRLMELHALSVEETSMDDLKKYCEEAKDLADELQGDASTKMLNEIEQKYMEVAELSKPKVGEVIIKVNDLIATMANATDKNEITKMYTEAKDLLKGIPETDETKKMSGYMDKIYSAKVKPAKSQTAKK